MNKLLQYSFLLLIFSIGFMQPTFNVLNNLVPISDFIFLIVFSIWLLTLILGINKLRLSQFYIWIAIYVLAMLCSTIFATNPKQSLIKLLGEGYLICLAILTFNLVKNINLAKKTILTWILATIVGALISILTLLLFYLDRENQLLHYTLSHYGTLPSGNYPRIQSIYVNPNMLCNYLNIGVIWILLAHKLNWINTKLFIFLTIILAISIFLTLSPGIGGILLCIGIWFWLEYAEKGNFVLSRLSLVLGVLSAIFFFVVSLVSPTNLAQPSARILTWQSAFQTFLQNPIFGKGLGELVANVWFTDANGNQQFLGDAHNIWLSIAGQLGSFGLLAMCLLSFYLIKKSLPFSFNTKDNLLKTACGIAFLGTFFYQGLLGSFEDARHLWILIGLLASVCETDFSNKE
jgi:O-antigen ligase